MRPAMRRCKVSRWPALSSSVLSRGKSPLFSVSPTELTPPPPCHYGRRCRTVGVLGIGGSHVYPETNCVFDKTGRVTGGKCR